VICYIRFLLYNCLEDCLKGLDNSGEFHFAKFVSTLLYLQILPYDACLSGVDSVVNKYTITDSIHCVQEEKITNLNENFRQNS